jgi:hypothetical protein
MLVSIFLKYITTYTAKNHNRKFLKTLHIAQKSKFLLVRHLSTYIQMLEIVV